MKKMIPMNYADLPKSYAALAQLYPPRPIHSAAECQRTVAFIDLLAGRELNADQADYLDALSFMVERYEADSLKNRLADVAPADVLRHLIEENNMNVSDLGRVVGSQPLASLILSGKRSISREVAMRLARHFALSPAVFLGNPVPRRKTA